MGAKLQLRKINELPQSGTIVEKKLFLMQELSKHYCIIISAIINQATLIVETKQCTQEKIKVRKI
ncbi:hypothetical protein J2Y02_004323 [Neobacillus drentensis]|nr:hypothetical protein [Neobacillus drentensis]